tara:strand:+ start:6539 stop:7036 length:498 start_codon:yes stop_codon:yes gene_type:complete
LQIKISKAAFWLECTSLLAWIKLLVLPVAAWFIFYFINSEWIAATAYRVTLALLMVFLSFYVIERLSLWVSNLPGEQKLIAAFDQNNLQLALEETAKFPVSEVLEITFLERTFINGIRWPHRKNIIRITMADRIEELQTNFNYLPLLTFLKQVDRVVKKQQADKH